MLGTVQLTCDTSEMPYVSIISAAITNRYNNRLLLSAKSLFPKTEERLNRLFSGLPPTLPSDGLPDHTVSQPRSLYPDFTTHGKEADAELRNATFD